MLATRGRHTISCYGLAAEDDRLFPGAADYRGRGWQRCERTTEKRCPGAVFICNQAGGIALQTQEYALSSIPLMPPATALRVLMTVKAANRGTMRHHVDRGSSIVEL
jgi:hypothetical protein